MLLGTLSVEAIYQDRDQFAQLVREVAAPDVGRMGIEILSFTIKDVYDSVEYLESLGRAQTANVKRDADIGVAEANRDAGIRVRTSFISSRYCCLHHCCGTLALLVECQVGHLSCEVKCYFSCFQMCDKLAIFGKPVNVREAQYGQQDQKACTQNL